MPGVGKTTLAKLAYNDGRLWLEITDSLLISMLDVRDCPNINLRGCHPFLRELNMTDMKGWRRLHIDYLDSFTALIKLTVARIPELASIGEWQPLQLECLEISDCPSMEELPNKLHSLKSLKGLRICHCPRLVSFPETGLPPMLRILGSSSHFLERLKVQNCPSLVCFPDVLPSTLKQLVIESCTSLKALPDARMQASSSSSGSGSTRSISDLEILKIKGCPSLKGIPLGNFPSSLKHLEIWNCELLEPISGQLLCNNAALEYLQMWNYPNLRTLEGYLIALDFFPLNGLPNDNLKELWIENCGNLKSLPPQMQNLTSLQNLYVQNCPSLMSVPEGGLPPNVTSLGIEDCQNIQTHLSDWGLHRLTSLKAFRISGACSDVVSFRENDCLLLPRNLTWLSVNELQNLESLAFLGLQNLNSLKELLISDCPELRSFLPDKGLPAILSRLEIKKCPILIKRCLKERGEYWTKIAHIPRIEIFD
ncbi:hypothetical protein PVL29_017568 [Vitis rotundifolia]|uniref:Disease resistance protein At4g27190-like leucine-rich repeats domain-containing protein n=1 Tax=Vitis rotundifolia TaxID=103349 RepID=A0AA38ZAT8_VITRO|nr:hypothetical protein PVL29_017568 [Vitis rotundifolia]